MSLSLQAKRSLISRESLWNLRTLTAGFYRTSLLMLSPLSLCPPLHHLPSPCVALSSWYPSFRILLILQDPVQTVIALQYLSGLWWSFLLLIFYYILWVNHSSFHKVCIVLLTVFLCLHTLSPYLHCIFPGISQSTQCPVEQLYRAW